MFLVGDVGGTKIRLALADRKDDSFSRQEIEEFASRDYSGLDQVVTAFLKNKDAEIHSACFGVPGPVRDGEAKTTNLAWELSETNLVRNTRLKQVKLVNDLVATTAAVPYLGLEDLVVLHPGDGEPKHEEPCAVVAPGTGLGQGFLSYLDGRLHVHASEGGHVDFAPNNEAEIELLRFLLTKHKRISYERIIAGPGLLAIYEFLKETGRAAEPAELRERLAKENPAAAISKAGVKGEFEICVKALDMFVSVLGAQAGNLVLTVLATGGLYLGGGVPPKILEKLKDGTILKSYLNKGRLSSLVEKTPLYVVKDDRAALLGAAHFASQLE